MSSTSATFVMSARRRRSRGAIAILCGVALLASVLTVLPSQSSSATDALTDVNLGTAAAYSSISSGALTVGAGAGVAGSAVVGAGAASTTGDGAVVGAAVDGIEQAQADVAVAYADAASRPPTATFDGDISGATFVPGVYHAGAAIANNTTVTLDALGNPDAVFIFQIMAAFASAAESTMVLVNGAQARHVYWQVLGAVTIGANATFAGTILADGAVTVGANTVISGRTLTISGAVSLGAGMGTLGVPEISITNSPSPSDLVFDGETITFTFLVTNSGNVALNVPKIVINGIPAVSNISYAWTATPGVLLPKQSVTGTATYLATFADAVKRSVTATAVVAGTSSTDVIVLATQAKTVIVWPIPVVDAVIVSQGEATSFDVLTNDQTLPTGVGFSRTQLTGTPRAIGAAANTVPRAAVFGSVTCSDSGQTRGFCTYASSALFSGIDGFDYSVSQLGRSWNVHVTVTVSTVATAPLTRDDRVVATTGGPAVSVMPLANDADGGLGTLLIASADSLPVGEGNLSCSVTSCTYTPPVSGFVGTVVAHYVATDRSVGGVNGPLSSATITIFVDAAAVGRPGFTSSPSAAPTVTAGDWVESAIMATPASSCLSERPQTAVAWSASTRATSWTIQRRTVPRAPGVSPSAWADIAVVSGAATSFLDDRVGESTDFQYRVRPDLYRWEGVFSDASASSTTPDAVSAVGC